MYTSTARSKAGTFFILRSALAGHPGSAKAQAPQPVPRSLNAPVAHLGAGLPEPTMNLPFPEPEIASRHGGEPSSGRVQSRFLSAASRLWILFCRGLRLTCSTTADVPFFDRDGRFTFFLALVLGAHRKRPVC